MSETVKRYDPELCDCEYDNKMQRSPDGDWVASRYAALAQRLADVAYLEAWGAADLRRCVYSVGVGGTVRWIAVDPLTPADVIAESVSALGALLRQREEG